MAGQALELGGKIGYMFQFCIQNDRVMGKTEDRRQKTEDGRQKTEDGRQKTEDRIKDEPEDFQYRYQSSGSNRGCR